MRFSSARVKEAEEAVLNTLLGIRENGGQYTHAATWVVLAAALQGRADLALRLWNVINPIHHATTPAEVDRYKVEPSWSAPMCMVLLRTPGGAAGRGIQALRVGFTASRSKQFSASAGKATPFASSHASRRAGLALRWSIAITPQPTRFGPITRRALAAASAGSNWTGSDCRTAPYRYLTTRRRIRSVFDWAERGLEAWRDLR